ncbi:LLM class flavin-dependent oxidoreductase [Mycolicibacterium sphagni]|uniref:LLM class flavin-dependent oxidoreductase n=1 Tax=Mycolicibacterium sphagni TaxID=1786 RepID=UPI0013FDD15F|nr:LLM class flavin-dependent oxidoreductase [Mycolicibacterium sphagni]
MRFGIFTTLEDAGLAHDAGYEEFLDQAVLAEELGYDSVWLAEHHGSAYGTIPRPSIFATAVAMRTSRIRIGTLVTILPFCNPVRTAEDWAMVDVLSGGRVDLGVGRGYQPSEFALMGADPTFSREVFSEGLEVLLGLWRNESFSFTGKHFTLRDAQVFPRPIQSGGPPVWVGALSPEGFAVVAKHGLNLAMQPTMMPMPVLKDAAVEAARTLIDHGRRPESIDFPLQMMVHIAPTKAKAREIAHEPINWFFDRVLTKVPGAQGPAAASYEFYKQVADQMSGAVSLASLEEAGIVMVCDPDQAIETLTQLQTDIGTKQFSAWMRFGGLADEHVRNSMKLFAAEVMPHIPTDSPTPAAFTNSEIEPFTTSV